MNLQKKKMQDWPVIYENCFLRPEGQMDKLFHLLVKQTEPASRIR